MLKILAALCRVLAKSYELEIKEHAENQIKKLAKKDRNTLKKVQKALKALKDQGPDYPGLKTHKWTGDKHEGQQVWVSYAGIDWRVFWVYEGQGIMVLSVRYHPDKDEKSFK